MSVGTGLIGKTVMVRFRTRSGRVRASASVVGPFGLLVVMSVIVAGALTILPPAGACTWSVPLPHLAEYADEVAVAFVGREIVRRESEQRTVLVFEVHRVHKGEAGPLIQVIAAPYHSPCDTFRSEGTTAVVTYLAEQDLNWVKPGELWVGSILEPSILELEEVFGPGYPPDPTIELPEFQMPEPPGNSTTSGQTVAVGIALVLLVAGLITIRRLRQRTRRSSS